MERKIDLHIHSNFSDGKFTPFEIVDEAKKNGVSVISITDHDNIDAYSIELYDYAISNNIKIINGIELSTKLGRLNIHVLGYNFALNNKAFKDKLITLKNARHIYLYKVSIILKQLGYILDINKLNQIDSVTKAHIANDVINNKSNQKLLLEQFGKIPSIGQFIETMLNEGCPAYVEKNMITTKEACDIIKNAGGKVILAHPISYKYENNLTDKDIAYLINKLNIDGIESNYIYVDKNNRKINEIEKWNKVANYYNLITTIGSDFHEFDEYHSNIGLINENFELTDGEISSIINNLLK